MAPVGEPRRISSQEPLPCAAIRRSARNTRAVTECDEPSTPRVATSAPADGVVGCARSATRRAGPPATAGGWGGGRRGEPAAPRGPAREGGFVGAATLEEQEARRERADEDRRSGGPR